MGFAIAQPILRPTSLLRHRGRGHSTCGMRMAYECVLNRTITGWNCIAPPLVGTAMKIVIKYCMV